LFDCPGRLKFEKFDSNDCCSFFSLKNNNRQKQANMDAKPALFPNVLIGVTGSVASLKLPILVDLLSAEHVSLFFLVFLHSCLA